MSPKVEALAEELETMRSEITELDAVEEPTDEQALRYEELLKDWDSKKADHDKLVERAEKVAAVRTAALNPGNIERGFSAPNVTVRQDPFENLEALRFNMDAPYAPSLDDDEAIIARAVTAFTDKEYRVRGVSDKQLETLVEKLETIPGVARHALLHGSKAYRSAFKQYLQSQGNTPLYSAEETDAVRTALSLTGANGGYTLPTLLDPTLIRTGTAVKDNLRAISRVISGTQNVWHGVSVGNVTSYWTAEATAMTEGSPTLSNPSVTAYKLTAWLTGSYEIFEDSDLQSQLPGLIAESFSFKEQTAFISGDGTTSPQGIVTAISATAGSTVTATTRGSFTSASAVDVFALVNAVTPRYEDTSTWVASKQTFNLIRQMSTASQGSYFWTNFNNDTVGQGGNQPLLGSPILQASDMGSTYTSGTVFAILGDFSQYVIYDRIGTSVEFVPQVFNSSGLPLGQRGLVAHKRVGAAPTDINAFRFLKG